MKLKVGERFSEICNDNTVNIGQKRNESRFSGILHVVIDNVGNSIGVRVYSECFAPIRL